jgi:hypothetical protein
MDILHGSSPLPIHANYIQLVVCFGALPIAVSASERGDAGEVAPEPSRRARLLNVRLSAHVEAKRALHPQPSFQLWFEYWSVLDRML